MKETATHIATSEEKQIWEILEQVKDPEVPVLSVIDLGIIRDVYIKLNQTEGEEKM